jgi:murein DD-endopeptidase MepM/ murein hydrolase activator NlpD
MNHQLHYIIGKYTSQFHQVVDFDPSSDKLLAMDMSGGNPRLAPAIFANTNQFSRFITQELTDAKARYGVGGYLEDRVIYSQSAHFGNTNGDTTSNDSRTIHLGIDIWGPAKTEVFAPWGGSVHSVAYNKADGDYGATIILQHQLEGLSFHTLYGHLSVKDLALTENQYVSFGEPFAHFGPPEENGNWPPHLHFQIIIDMELKRGDYPGVCNRSKIDYYKYNCPDPDLILDMRKYVKA